MNKKIAFFDFDGTITTKDSFLEIIRFVKGEPSFILGFLRLSPWILAMKLGLLSNSEVKQKVMRFFFGQMPVDEFRAQCERFARVRVPLIIRKKAMQRIQDHLDDRCSVVVVSASPQAVVDPWCRQMQVDCIATRLQIKEGRITGNIDGKNCHGLEKVRRIREQFDLSLYDEIYAYGDSPGDKPMLALANFPSYKPFRNKG